MWPTKALQNAQKYACIASNTPATSLRQQSSFFVHKKSKKCDPWSGVADFVVGVGAPEPGRQNTIKIQPAPKPGT